MVKSELCMDMKIEYCRHELSAWSRALDYQQQENIYLKTLLAEILKNSGRQLPDKVEYYQSQLINNDTLLALIRHDIVEQSKMLKSPATINPDKFLNTSNKLRSDMEKMEKELSGQKYALNNYFQNSYNLFNSTFFPAAFH